VSSGIYVSILCVCLNSRQSIRVTAERSESESVENIAYVGRLLVTRFNISQKFNLLSVIITTFITVFLSLISYILFIANECIM